MYSVRHQVTMLHVIHYVTQFTGDLVYTDERGTNIVEKLSGSYLL